MTDLIAHRRPGTRIFAWSFNEWGPLPGAAKHGAGSIAARWRTSYVS